MKKVLIIVFLAANIFYSCSTDNHQKIGFLLPNLTDARYPKDRDFLAAKVKELGGTVEIGDANNDPNLQEQQAKQMLDNGVKVLVVTAVNQNLAAAIVRMAHDKGVKVIAYERLIQQCDLDYFVSFDHFVVGKQQATYAIQKVPDGNYILISGDKRDKNAELIKQGQREILAPLIKSGKVNVMYDVFVEDWDAESAYKEVFTALNLSGKKADVVLCANDGMAGGVIRALQDFQPGYPAIVTGLDADLPACRRIVQGKQSMTIYKPFKKQAEIAGTLAMKIAMHEKYTDNLSKTNNGMVDVPTIQLESVPVDNANIKSTIIADGMYKETDIYQ